jgi:flagellar biosynthesis/type III secretory pathway protein FliH
MYDSQEKARLDYASGLIDARHEGRKEGRKEGFLAARVQLYQELLGEEVTSSDELLSKSTEELTALFESFQKRLRDRQT